MERVITYEDLPDTITVDDYGKWRRLGKAIASQKFHSKGFPRLQNCGNKLLADKRAVLLFELGLNEQDKQLVLKELAHKII